MSEQKPLKKIIGLRNIVTDGKQWKYLLFYDVDNPTEKDIANIIDFMNNWKISYIIYSTKAGLHLIGLTPLNIVDMATMFNGLHILIPEYYSGQTIRLSRKQNEIQELIFYNLDYPVISNLLKIYQKRFTFGDIPEVHSTSEQWRLVFEKYWSSKA